MRIHVRDRPYDLYSVMALSVLLLMVLVAVPAATPLRIVLGLPFILFFPGYALVSALYPERPIVIGEAQDAAEEDGYGRSLTSAARRQIRKDRKARGRIADPDEDEQGNNRKVKGIDGLERTALSLGLSIAISPLIGLVLNYTYDWDPRHLGIRLTTIFGSLFLFVMVTSIVAIKRRMAVPPEDRFGIDIDISFPEGGSATDKALTVGIAVMMVLSVSLLIYIIVVPREGESFTEFYVLGRNMKADDYPRYMVMGDTHPIFIGIGNHEDRYVNYSLVISISSSATNRTVTDLDGVILSRAEQPVMEIGLGDDDSVIVPCNFSVMDKGSFKLRLLLYKGGEEYLDLHLWVVVFSEDQVFEGPPFLFLSGEGNDPTLAGSVMSGRTVLTLGVVNRMESDIDVNATVTFGETGSNLELYGEITTGRVSPSQGVFTILRAEAGSAVSIEMELVLIEVTGPLTVSFTYGGSKVSLSMPLREEAP